jgi:hypothetical protein
MQFSSIENLARDRKEENISFPKDPSQAKKGQKQTHKLQLSPTLFA